MHSVRRRSGARTRHVLTVVLAVAALSACSGGSKKPAVSSVTGVITKVTLSVAGSGSGSGRISSSPAGIDCTISAGVGSGVCTAQFFMETLVTLQAEPTGSSNFLAFGGDCTLSTCQLILQAARSVSATFVPNMLSVMANATSVGGGRVVSTPAGIDCVLNGTAPGAGSCSSSFPTGTSISLSQEPTAGAVFQGWGSACSGNPCTLVLNGQRTVDATYRTPQSGGTLTITGAGSGTGIVTSSPDGIACTIAAGVTSGTCSAPFAAGVVVALTTVAPGSNSFTGFTGACSGTACTTQIASGATTTVGATFSAGITTASLTVSPSPASRGTGTITSAPSGISCTVSDGIATGACTATFPIGSVVTLTQAPTGNAIFQSWSGDCVGNPCQLAMSQGRVGEITYRLPQPGIVNISGSGAGTGSVTSTPSGISCAITAGVSSGTCSATFPAGSSVTLLSTGTNGSTFDGFGGACTGTSCVVPVVSAVTSTVTVAYTPAPQRLTVAPGSGSAGTGTVMSTPSGIACTVSGTSTSGVCSALFPVNTVVTLTQSTSGNTVFFGWTGECTVDPCQVVMSQARSALPIFKTQGVSVTGGGTGTGVVTSSPAGISCTVTGGVTAGTCAATFPPTAVVSLTATPSGLASFSGFAGNCNGTTCTISLVPGLTANVTAQFTAPPTITVTPATTSEGGGTISSAPAGVSCTLSYASSTGSCVTPFALGTVLNLTQTPTSGSVFVNWAGACTGSTTCQVTLSGSRAVQAVYRLAVPGSVTVMAGAGTGNGSVSSSPGGVACAIAAGVKSGICRAIFPVGSTVTLIPVAAAGSTFLGFSGSCSGMTCVMTVPENGDITVTANFSK